jgi:hypothetical protein
LVLGVAVGSATASANGAATASAIAAAISAGFAGATSVAAWITIRGRRPRLRVEVEVGNPEGGKLLPAPGGVALSVRVLNTSDSDLEVLDLWFEAAPGRRFAHRVRRLPAPDRFSPPTEWFVEGAGTIPGTVKAHHTELYAFRTETIGTALHRGGHRLYRPVVQTGVRAFRGNWIAVDVIDQDTTS